MSVLISRGCRNKPPQTAWLKQWELASLPSGDWQSEVPAGSETGENPLLGL